MSESKPKFRPSYEACHALSALCPLSATTYGYIPIRAPNAVYTAWFAILLILALTFGIKSKTWTYTLALGIGTALELAGYVGRLMMNPNPWSSSGFKLQICCLVLAPSALAACVYLTLKHLVTFFGPEHSPIRPRLYPWIFVGCDFASMCLQGIGGGVAAASDGATKIKLVKLGNRLIITGIAFQVATMAACGVLMATYLFRYHKARKSAALNSPGAEKSTYDSLSTDPKEKKKVIIFCWAIAIAYVTILIRCIYRLPEMAGGWGNPLMQNEREFLLLDGAMIAIATFLLTVFHPTFFFQAMVRGKVF